MKNKNDNEVSNRWKMFEVAEKFLMIQSEFSNTRRHKEKTKRKRQIKRTIADYKLISN